MSRIEMRHLGKTRMKSTAHNQTEVALKKFRELAFAQCKRCNCSCGLGQGRRHRLVLQQHEINQLTLLDRVNSRRKHLLVEANEQKFKD